MNSTVLHDLRDNQNRLASIKLRANAIIQTLLPFSYTSYIMIANMSFALIYEMLNGSNCPLNMRALVEFNSGSSVFKTELAVINVQMTCQQYIIQDVYENGNKVCIIAFAQSFIDAKVF